MWINKAFRHYKANYDLFNQFDLRYPKWKIKLITCIYLSFYYIGVSYILRKIIKNYLVRKNNLKKRLVYLLMSKNHYHTFKNLIVPEIDYSIIATIRNKNIKNSFFISDSLIIIASICNAKELKGFFNYKDVQIINNFPRVLKLLGHHFIFDVILNDVKTIVKFNDHSIYSTLIYDLCVKKGIKTVYVQHAPVSERFPVLHHDLNVLFSKDSFKKYKQSDVDSKTLVMFDFRIIPFISLVEPDLCIKNKVLICLNMLDGFESLRKLLSLLKNYFDIIIRPHPADRRNFNVFKGENIQISKNPELIEDMRLVGKVIANESAVALEALAAKRLFYKASFLSKHIDNYGFIKKGLVKKHYDTPENLKHALLVSENACDKTVLSFFIGNFDQIEDKLKLLNNEILSL
ncbi:hypothetical protein [Mesonia aestuariivivens]|uniref:Uncharacterized protein n=1 Tax=Mesonia aestuariivivens TaxID=2796128 RepID=A0ABS6W6Z9_9FLAO|nr:hypothetical protein [Mesonia aestuariivivens]MBW2962893.1 hypothetical protein [Mesonia aestuariivivens]